MPKKWCCVVCLCFYSSRHIANPLENLGTNQSGTQYHLGPHYKVALKLLEPQPSTRNAHRKMGSKLGEDTDTEKFLIDLLCRVFVNTSRKD